MLTNFSYSGSAATPDEWNIIANRPSRQVATPGAGFMQVEDLWCCLYVQLITDPLSIVVSNKAPMERQSIVRISSLTSSASL